MTEPRHARTLPEGGLRTRTLVQAMARWLKALAESVLDASGEAASEVPGPPRASATRGKRPGHWQRHTPQLLDGLEREAPTPRLGPSARRPPRHGARAARPVPSPRTRPVPPASARSTSEVPPPPSIPRLEPRELERLAPSSPVSAPPEVSTSED